MRMLLQKIGLAAAALLLLGGTAMADHRFRVRVYRTPTYYQPYTYYQPGYYNTYQPGYYYSTPPGYYVRSYLPRRDNTLTFSWGNHRRHHDNSYYYWRR